MIPIPDISNIENWKKAIVISLISYSMMLFAVIAVDVFYKRDFILKEVAIISGSYMAVILLLMIVAAFTYKIKLDSRN